MSLPKRFPNRDEIAPVLAEAERLEPGSEGAEERRLAGRVMARRDMGKLVFLDLVDRSGRIQLFCQTQKTGEIDVDLGDVVGAIGVAAEDAPRRAQPRRDEPRAAREDPRPATGHLPRRHRRRDAFPQALPRPADERGVARRRDPPLAHGRGDPPLPRRARLPRGRDAGPPAALRRRVRGAVRDAPQPARPRPLPAHRDRALPQAPDRRRARARVRDRQGLPQRGHLLQAPARVHDARVVRGLRGLPRHDGADRGPRRDRRPRGASAERRCTFRGHEIELAKPWRRVKFADALAEHGMWTRDEAELRAALQAADVDTDAATRPGRSSSTTRTATSSSRR